MIKTCPECETVYSGWKCNVCGYKEGKQEKKQDVACRWLTNNQRCQIIGTIGNNQGLYCSWHFDCLNNPNMAKDNNEFDKWSLKRFGYICHPNQFKRSLGIANAQELQPLIYKKDNNVLWDSNNIHIIKGLAFLGVHSQAFKCAPKECQEKALVYMQKQIAIIPTNITKTINVETTNIELSPFPEVSIDELDYDIEERLAITHG